MHLIAALSILLASLGSRSTTFSKISTAQSTGAVVLIFQFKRFARRLEVEKSRDIKAEVGAHDVAGKNTNSAIVDRAQQIKCGFGGTLGR